MNFDRNLRKVDNSLDHDDKSSHLSETYVVQITNFRVMMFLLIKYGKVKCQLFYRSDFIARKFR